ncbi:MAG: hypothetical protein KDE62_04140 [Calditrichaeota bacterium]|nr:hypothetical protein [Calditrichota bacterium]
MSKLLINEHPLIVLPSLVKAITEKASQIRAKTGKWAKYYNCLNEAIILQQLHFLLSVKGRESRGKKWVKLSYADWQSEYFPYLSVATVKRSFHLLYEIGLIDIVNDNKNPIDKTNSFTIVYEAVDALLASTAQVDTTTDQVDTTTAQVDTTTDQVEGYRSAQVDTTTAQVDPSYMYKETVLKTDTETTADCAPARAAVIAALQKLGAGTNDAGSLVDRYGPEKVDSQIQRLEWGMRFPDWARKVKSKKGWIAGSLKQAAENGEGYNIPEGFVSRAEREKAKSERETREAEHQRREAERQAAEAAEAARVAAVNQAYLDFLATLPQPAREDIHRTALELLKADSGGFAWHRYEAGLKLKQKIEEMPAVYPVYLRQVCSTVRARYPDEGLPDLPAAEAM